MKNTHITSTPVRLEGFQNAFKPSKFGKCGLMAIVDQAMVDALEEERPGAIDWAKSKHKNPKRAMVRIEPWEEVADGQFQVKFNWTPENPVPIVDSEGTPIKDEIPLYSGSMVKLAFNQKPYVTPDAVGTSLKLVAVQVIQASGTAGVDTGTMDHAEASALFGQSAGFVVDSPNVTTTTTEETEESDDF